MREVNATMDFVGQKLAENICVVLVLLGAAVSFGIGYTKADFSLMIQIFGGFVAVAFLLVGPDWPFYNLNPVKWLPSTAELEKEKESSSQSNKGSKR